MEMGKWFLGLNITPAFRNHTVLWLNNFLKFAGGHKQRGLLTSPIGAIP